MLHRDFLRIATGETFHSASWNDAKSRTLRNIAGMGMMQTTREDKLYMDVFQLYFHYSSQEVDQKSSR